MFEVTDLIEDIRHCQETGNWPAVDFAEIRLSPDRDHDSETTRFLLAAERQIDEGHSIYYQGSVSSGNKRRA